MLSALRAFSWWMRPRRLGLAASISRRRWRSRPGRSALLERLERRGITVFGADLWASDWSRIPPSEELALVLGRIEANRGGIVLLHDTKARTAAMLPAFLRALKVRGYLIVHVVSGAEGVK